MIDQTTFLQRLNELKEIAKAQGNVLTGNEVQDFFEASELSQEYFKHVSNYLAENKIIVKDTEDIDLFDGCEDSSTNISNAKNESYGAQDERYLKMYFDELEDIEKLDNAELSGLLVMVRNNESSAIKRLTEGMLHRVVSIANNYRNQGVFIEDLIQEGNIGLLSAMQSVATIENMENYIPFLEESIKMSILTLIDDYNDKDSLENTLVAKSNLLHEAAKKLEEDLDRAPSVLELEEYTKMTEAEIKNILDISKTK